MSRGVAPFGWLLMLVFSVPLTTRLAYGPAASFAERLGAGLGAISSIGLRTLPKPSPEPPDMPPPTTLPVVPPEPVQPALRARRGRHSSALDKMAFPRTQSSAGVRIGRAGLQRLIARRHVPSSQAVSATPSHPGGLMLPEGSSLGVGMRDGDIITEISGVPVATSGEATRLVLQALQQRVPVIQGRFYRAGSYHPLSVEVPYPSASAPKPPMSAGR